MSNYAAVPCWIMFVASLIINKIVELESSKDRDYVITTYNFSTDLCVRLSSHPNPQTKEAADFACLWAFEALDRLKENLCDDWRRPECRLLEGFKHYQCTSMIPSGKPHEFPTYEVSTFRNCAWTLHTQEVLTDQAPVRSFNFERIQQQIYDQAVQRSRRNSYQPDPGPSDKMASTSLTAQEPHKCDVCGRRYVTKQSLKDHQKSHEQDLRCLLCGGEFSTVGNLKQHMKAVHSYTAGTTSGLSSNPFSGQAAKKGLYNCEVCGKKYEWKSSLNAHRKTHREDIRCKSCNKEYSSRANYKKHMRDTHPHLAAAEEAAEKARRMMKKIQECYLCKVQFASKKSLVAHMSLHKGETICHQCNLVFPTVTSLATHIRNEHT